MSAAPAGLAGSRTGSDPTDAAAHPPLQFYTLVGTTNVVTSRHDHLALLLRAEHSRHGTADFDQPRAADSQSVDLSIQLATHDGTESDLWDFPLPAGAFTANLKTSVGRLAAKSKISPYGSLHLVIKPKGKLHTEGSCPQERQTRREVQVRGHFLFKTAPAAAHGLGTVGSRKGTFSFRATLMSDYSAPNDNPKCEVQSHQPCPTAVTAEFFGPTQPDGTEVSFIASPRGTSTVLEGSRNLPLRKPRGAQLVDEVQTRTDALTITTQQQGTSVTINGKGPRAAGSVTLNAPEAPLSYQPDYCTHPSSQVFYNAVVATDPAPTLRFHSQVAGVFSVPNEANAASYFTYQRN